MASETVILAGRPAGQAGEAESLVSITGYCPRGGFPATIEIGRTSEELAPTPSDASDVRRLSRLMGGFELRARLRRYAADRRIALCGSVVYTDPTIITEQTGEVRRARWTGIVLCNRAGCPVCGAAKTAKFQSKVLRTLSAGGHWQHVIFTVPHAPADDWVAVYERLLHGLRDLSHGETGGYLQTQVEATIRSTETTWSERSGWHVHFHVLWKVRGTIPEYERELIRRVWAERTGASPERGVWFGAEFQCDSADMRESAARYIAKLGHEMGGTGKSPHPEHWSLGELYQVAAETGDFARLVTEYQASVKGRRLWQFDKRATRLHDAAPPEPEEIVEQSWITVVHREEFRGLSRRERFGGEPLATYLPLEVAVRARGDPRDTVEDTIYSLLAGVPEGVVCLEHHGSTSLRCNHS